MTNTPYSLINPLPIAVLVSGNGSNLQAIINAIAHDQLPAVIRVVVSNREDAYGLERARLAGIPTAVISRRDHADRLNYDRALHAYLERYNPQLIVLAGFMHILGGEFVGHYPNRILNIHPSLLPSHPGLNTHQRVLDAGDKVHGATVHVVTAELDAGPILAQASIDVGPGDTAESLQQKIHEVEHKLYPEVIRGYALGQFTRN